MNNKLKASQNMQGLSYTENKRTDEFCNNFERCKGIIKQTVLLHSCCGPCSTSVIERLSKDYEIIVYFYNPNIDDPLEYEKRKRLKNLYR